MVSSTAAKFQAPKFFSRASSVIFVRQDKTLDPQTPLNYKLLFFKRNPALRSAGGYWAFPGGKVEAQDQYQGYQESLPQFYKNNGRYFHDLDSRIACIRECFEETNIRLSKKPVQVSDIRATLDKDFGGNFLNFAQNYRIEPAVDQLFAHLRIGPPFGEEAQTTTQFYLCFDNDQENKVLGCDIKLQASEFVEHNWLSVKTALELYERSQLDLFPPQVIMMASLLLKRQSYDQLVAETLIRQRSPQAYIPERGHRIAVALNDPKDAKRQIRELFDEWDLQPDCQKQDSLCVYTNEDLIKSIPELHVFGKNHKSQKTYDQLYEGLKCAFVMIMQSDFYSNQENNVGIRVDRRQRMRVFGLNVKQVFRVEVSSSVFNSTADGNLFGKL